MFFQRLQFDVQRGGDVHPRIGLFRPVDVDAFDLVRFVPRCEQVGENEARLRGREDRVQRGLRGGAVVGMIDVAVAVKHALRVADDDRLGLVLADEARQFLAEREGRFQFAIGISEEDRLVDADDFVRRLLLALAQFRECGLVLFAMLGFVRACVPAGEDDRDDLATRPRPFGERPRDGELLVIGVGVDGHGAFGKVFFFFWHVLSKIMVLVLRREII